MRRWITALCLAAGLPVRGDAHRARTATPISAPTCPTRSPAATRLRVIVFGQDGLQQFLRGRSRRLDLDAAHRGGRVPRGLTTAALEKVVEAKLKNGFIREPKVSIEGRRLPALLRARRSADRRPVSLYRGHDRRKRRWPSPAASRRAPTSTRSTLTRVVDGHPVTASVPVDQPVKPGDTLFVRERFFLSLAAQACGNMTETRALPDHKLRVLHVLRAPLGGLFRHVLDLTREQVSRGHEVGLVVDSLTGGAHAERGARRAGAPACPGRQAPADAAGAPVQPISPTRSRSRPTRAG